MKVHVCSFCVARESSAKVIITKHMPAKVKLVAAKASRKVPRKRFVGRGFYVSYFRHRSLVICFRMGALLKCLFEDRRLIDRVF